MTLQRSIFTPPLNESDTYMRTKRRQEVGGGGGRGGGEVEERWRWEWIWDWDWEWKWKMGIPGSLERQPFPGVVGGT